MTRYDKFKSLACVREEYVLESMPDYLCVRGNSRRGARQNPIVRFFSSSWGAACVCTVVALTVMAFIIRAGQDPLTPPAVSVEPPTESETVTEAESTPYFDPETLDLDTYQGMAPDIPYTITYSSNGDGTCRVSGITVNILYEGEYTVVIPETSPDGETVIGISLAPTYNIPSYIPESEFLKIKEAVIDYYKDSPDQPAEQVEAYNFYYKEFMSYFQLKGTQYCTTPELQADLLATYPVCEYMDMYVLDPTITPEERAKLARTITAAAPWYTPEWCYADLLKVKDVADEHGVTDPYLEASLSAHSDHLQDAVTVTLPQTLTDMDETTPEILASLGITSLTFDGTIEMYFDVSSVESAQVRSTLTVHCIDGYINYPVYQH